MKYIRTSILDDEKIYEITTTKVKDLYALHSKDTIQPISIEYLNQIGKTADTIEELCDEFVLKRNKLIESEKLNEIHIGADTLEELKPAITICDNNIAYELYGAIWTEWGLKYVAKMNEKGRFELL